MLPINDALHAYSQKAWLQKQFLAVSFFSALNITGDGDEFSSACGQTENNAEFIYVPNMTWFWNKPIEIR